MSVVVITGCSSGFGLQTALAFARRGDDVYATMRNPDNGAALLELADAQGLAVTVTALDVNDDASVAAGFAEILARHGAVDVLVNNAGIAYSAAVETANLDRARAVLETNFWGAVRTIQAALPSMRAKRSGVIINVASIAGRVAPTPYGTWYSASKHAISSLSESLVIELHGTGVQVVNVEPGFYRTEIGQKSAAAAQDFPADDRDAFYAAEEAWISRYYGIGLRDGGDPADVAAAIVAAANDPSTPLHVPMPPGLAEVIAADRSTPFEEALPGRLAAWEAICGPRPPR